MKKRWQYNEVLGMQDYVKANLWKEFGNIKNTFNNLKKIHKRFYELCDEYVTKFMKKDRKNKKDSKTTCHMIDVSKGSYVFCCDTSKLYRETKSGKRILVK